MVPLVPLQLFPLSESLGTLDLDTTTTTLAASLLSLQPPNPLPFFLLHLALHIAAIFWHIFFIFHLPLL